jgi:hypothetical protein
MSRHDISAHDDGVATSHPELLVLRRSLSLAALLLACGTVLAATPAEAASALQIGRIQYDSPGTDTRSVASLNAEYVAIKNVSASNRSMTGFTVRDAQHHVYTFGTFTLRAGRSVRLRTGKGTNTATDRYWGSANYIWNNSGDKATLKNRAGTTLDSCSWAADGVGYTHC